MRRLLVAGLAALAVVLGLTLSVGTAFAADETPVPAPPTAQVDAGIKADVRVGIGADLRGSHTCVSPQVYDPRTHRCETPGSGTPLTCTPPQVLDTVLNVCVDPRTGGHGGGNGGPWGGGNGGHWIPGGHIPWGGPSLYGHQLWVEANLGLDICGFGNSYDTFLNRNLRYRSTIDRLLNRSRWQSLYTSDCNSGLAVLPGGLTLVNGNLINLDLLGLQGGGLQSVCSYADYNVFSDHFRGRFGNRWDSVRNRFGSNGFNVYRQLQNNARCTTIVMPSSTTIVQAPNTVVEAAPQASDPSGNEAAAAPAPAVAAPLASGPVPSGAVQTGGDSPAWVLAHARAV